MGENSIVFFEIIFLKKNYILLLILFGIFIVLVKYLFAIRVINWIKMRGYLKIIL